MMKRTNVVVIGIVVAVSFPLFAAVMAPRTDLSDDLGTGSRRWGSAYIGHLSATNTDTSAEVDAKIDAIDAKVAETVPYTGATKAVDLGAHEIAAGNLSGDNTGDGTVSDSAELDFALTGSDITASLIAASIDETKLDASVNDSLDLADSAIQTELDPVFDASQAANIDAGDITNLGNLSGNNTGDEDLSVYDTSLEVDAKVAASTNALGTIAVLTSAATVYVGNNAYEELTLTGTANLLVTNTAFRASTFYFVPGEYAWTMTNVTWAGTSPDGGTNVISIWPKSGGGKFAIGGAL